jgi:hypothetical protein
MSNERRQADKNLGLFLNPGGAASEGGYLIPMDNLNVGPGKPGPGDEWHMPPESGDGPVGGTAPTTGPAPLTEDQPRR